MASITVQRRINASPDRVWKVLTGLEKLPQVIDSITEVERLDIQDGFVVGTRWRETRKILGRQASEVMEVSHVEFEQSFRTEAESHGAHYTTEHTLVPVGNVTDVTLVFTGRPISTVGRIIGAIMLPLMRSATRKALESDLESVAAWAEKSD